jgi:ribonuclease-3
VYDKEMAVKLECVGYLCCSDPSMTPVFTRPTFGPNDTFPDLPKIQSDVIRLQVFTHRSFFARPTHIFEDHPEDLSPDNEK